MERVSVAVVVGVAGVGKSALAHAYAARFADTSVYARVGSEPLGSLLDDVRRQLERGTVPELFDDEARALDLAERLDREPSLLVLEDLHLCDTAAASDLLATLSRSLRAGRVLATSRHRPARRPSDPDRFELALEGLGEEGSRAMWAALDELYGPSLGFEQAKARCLGNPFQLRRAHAGGLEDDPIAAAVDALSGDELAVVSALTVLERRAPLAMFQALLGAERARRAIKQLVTQLIVELDGSSNVGVHTLFRDALRPRLSSQAQREMASQLADQIETLGLDRVAALREQARLLRLAGRFEECIDLLTARSNELVRDGAASELVRGLEAIGEDKLGAAARLALARGYYRMMQHEKAHLYAQGLAAREGEPSAELSLLLATTALSTGRAAEGERVLRGLLAREQLPSPLRTEAERQLAVAMFHLGDGDEARAFVDRHTPPEASAFAAYFRVMTLVQEHATDARLGDAVEGARRIGESDAPAHTTRVLVPMMLSAALARLGRVEEARALCGPAEREAESHEDLQTQTYVSRLRAELDLAEGDRKAAFERVLHCTQAYRQAGSHLGQLQGNAALVRLLFERGRLREARALAQSTREAAASRGLRSVERALVRAEEHDPLVALTLPLDATNAGHLSERARTTALRALVAAGKGDAKGVARLQAEIAALVERPHHAVERALLLLARATLSRLEGRGKEAAKLTADARAALAAEGADDDLLDQLVERVGGARIVTTKDKRTTKSAEAKGFELVLHGGKHELRAGRTVVELGKKPTLRKLLYALASRPNQPVTKAELASAIWPTRYDPLRHDGALWVNLRRLRQLLAKSKLSIELVEDGYRLVAPDSFVFLDPGS